MAKIPYDELTLRMAMLSIPEDEALLTLLDEIVSDCGVLGDPAALNKQVAEAHGISVVDLINSPNRKDLIGEYQIYFLKNKVVSRLVEYGLNDKQAWAIVALGLNLI